jgi:hypothetical protein
MVIVPQKAALSLMANLLDENKIETAYGQLQKMIVDGDAELVAHLVSRAQERERSVSESVEEMRYGTEFDPPQLPQNAPENIAVLKDWPLTGITPTGFETRNIGATLEIFTEVQSSRNRLLVNVTPQHVRFLRWVKTDAGKLANGEHLYVEQPIFHTMKNTSSLIVKNDQRILLGAHKVPDRPDRIELFLLRVTAKAAEPK